MRLLSLVIDGDRVTGASGVPQGGTVKLASIIEVGLNLLVVGGVLLALIFIVWGGYNWASSEGDKQKLEQARQKIVFAVIGLILVFLSFFIIRLITDFFRVTYVPEAPCGTPRPGGPPVPC